MRYGALRGNYWALRDTFKATITLFRQGRVLHLGEHRAGHDQDRSLVLLWSVRLQRLELP